jgi:ATP-dependent Clp protease, protease subunit
VTEFDSLNLDDKTNFILSSNNCYFLTGPISVESCAGAIKWIVSENLNSKKKKVLTLYINSEGGDLYQAFALVDVIKCSTHTIRTIGVGQVMSAAFLIFAAGSKGHRFLGKNTGLMCHQYSSDLGSVKHHDLQAALTEGNICDDKMLDILVSATGLLPAEVQKHLLNSTDKYIDADMAITLGVADSILEKFS